MNRIRIELSVWEDDRGNIHLASVDRRAHPTLSAYVQGNPDRANYHAKLYDELKRALDRARGGGAEPAGVKSSTSATCPGRPSGRAALFAEPPRTRS